MACQFGWSVKRRWDFLCAPFVGVALELLMELWIKKVYIVKLMVFSLNYIYFFVRDTQMGTVFWGKYVYILHHSPFGDYVQTVRMCLGDLCAFRFLACDWIVCIYPQRLLEASRSQTLISCCCRLWRFPPRIQTGSTASVKPTDSK